MKKIRKVILTLVIGLMFFGSYLVQADNNMNWEDWRNEEYWEWHTRTTTNDKAYNGNHIQINGDVINFYGYWQNSYKDFLYKQYDRQGKKTFKFKIDESKASYHTLDGAGFIFNANKKDNKLSGYVLLFKEKQVCLYRLDNVDIETFKTKANARIDEYGELIVAESKVDSKIHELIVEATPTSIKVIEADTEIINLNLDYSKHPGESFGLIASYTQHACSILSKIEFSELEIIIEDFEISILNTDLQGNAISGGYFEIKDKDGQIIKEGKTNENGTINIDGILPGIYTVQQKLPPSTYILNDTIYEFEVTSEGKVVDVNSKKEIELIVKNEQLKLEIVNKDLDTENSISGSKIGLYDKNGNEVMTAITDEDGIATFIGIEEGEYTYKQLEVSEEYELNTNQYKCIINIDGTVVFEENDKNVIYNKKVEEEVEEEVKDEVKDEVEEEIKEEKDEKDEVIEEEIPPTVTTNKIDDTIAKKPIPKTGNDLNIYGIFLILAIISSITIFIKIKNKNF